MRIENKNIGYRWNVQLKNKGIRENRAINKGKEILGTDKRNRTQTLIIDCAKAVI